MDIPELSVKEKCISCKKILKKESKCDYLNYKDKEWCRSKNYYCQEACNWCYWYAWDNHVRCKSICNIFSTEKKKGVQVE
jgi:hypothetical protein